MSVVGEIGLAVAVVAVVAQAISAYRDGGGIVDRIKEKRAARCQRPIPRRLEDSIKETPDDIEREKRRGMTRFGQAFEQGDWIAVVTIQQITIQIQTSFLSKLRNAYDDTTDFTELINDADMGRDATIRALIDLQQRLLTAAPISSAPTLSQLLGQPVGRAQETQFATAPALPPTAAGERTQYMLENHHRNDSVTEPVIPSGRHHTFRIFNRQRKQQQSPEVDQLGFRRIQTIPTDSSSTIDEPTTRGTDSTVQTSNTPPQVTTPPSRNPSSSPRPHFQYEPWEDNPAEIWRRDNTRSVRISTYTPPDVPTPLSHPISPPMRASTSGSSSSSTSIPHPNSGNNYLGFCKGAWKVQDGDRNDMVVSKDYTLSASSAVKFLTCSECRFEGHFDPKIIWDRVFKFPNMKIRWSFLAKSHVHQKKPLSREAARRCDFTYQCIFCAFLGYPCAAIHGAPAYRDHIAKYHLGMELSDVVLYKAGCVNDRVCEDHENFDINLYPRVVEV